MTTWVQPIHHPWFDRSPLKRKLSNADDERRPSPYQRSSPSPTSRAKRRKFNTLEHGFAHLSLASAPVQSNSASGLLITPIAHPTVSSSGYSVFPPASVVLPSSVEEPPHEFEASAPEVSMEYEDERQCKLSSLQVSSSSFESTYTDFSDTMASDADMPTAHADSDKLNSYDDAPSSPRFSISTPFLQRIRKHQTAPQPIIPISSPSTAAGALVLYRPLRAPSPSRKVDEHPEFIEEIVTPEAAALLVVPESSPIDDDAMDVE